MLRHSQHGFASTTLFLHKCGNAEKTAPAVSTLADDTSTAAGQEQVLEWKFSRQGALIMMAIMIVSLTAALDATVLVPVLPVSKLKHPLI